jgi:hypothetical protein
VCACGQPPQPRRHTHPARRGRSTVCGMGGGGRGVCACVCACGQPRPTPPRHHHGGALTLLDGGAARCVAWEVGERGGAVAVRVRVCSPAPRPNGTTAAHSLCSTGARHGVWHGRWVRGGGGCCGCAHACSPAPRRRLEWLTGAAPSVDGRARGWGERGGGGWNLWAAHVQRLRLT